MRFTKWESRNIKKLFFDEELGKAKLPNLIGTIFRNKILIRGVPQIACRLLNGPFQTGKNKDNRVISIRSKTPKRQIFTMKNGPFSNIFERAIVASACIAALE